ncbi:MAG: DUF4166 domain-containing protein [Pseudomonadota bacterium]
MKPKRVLLIGGTGVFGRRLARHIGARNDIELILTSRSSQRAEALARDLNTRLKTEGKSTDAPAISGISLDRRDADAAFLGSLSPWLVIYASGPFQSWDHALAGAAIAAGAHVIDLADARTYLLTYPEALDTSARAKGVVALAGVSTTPTLSEAVVTELAADFRRVDTIDMAIAPAGRSEVGPAVLDAILGMAGQPVPIRDEGRLSSGIGWSDQQTITIPTLGRRSVARVETIDAERLGLLGRSALRVAFFAGLESSLERFGLHVLAALRRRGWLPDPKPLVPLLFFLRRILRVTASDRGGMVVRLTGIGRDGSRAEAEWSLVAEENDGLSVPILPAAAAVGALLARRLEPGARLGPDALHLADIEAETSPYAIETRIRRRKLEGSVFLAALGEAAEAALPKALRRFHAADGAPVWQGRADIDAGTGWLSSLAAAVFGLPAAGRDVPVTVSVDRRIGPDVGTKIDPVPPSFHTEIWSRRFGDRRFSSTLHSTRPGIVTEAAGPFAFDLGVQCDADGLSLPVVGWRLFGVRMPVVLAPVSVSREHVDDQDRFRFDIRVSLPTGGLLIAYRGWLMPLADAG